MQHLTSASMCSMTQVLDELPVEWVSIDDLRPHPRNYQRHPEDQLVHLVASITEHGFYRNVVVSREGVLLAGHGVVEAARRMNLQIVPVRRLDVEFMSTAALKVLTADNEISNLAEIDDRMLTELLREIMSDGDLLGTGFDEDQLSALVMITRPSSEIADKNAANEWLGLPEFEPDPTHPTLMIKFDDETGREVFMSMIGAERTISKHGAQWNICWPLRDRDDVTSVRFE